MLNSIFITAFLQTPLPLFLKSMKRVGVEPRNFFCFIFLFKICQELPAFLGLFKQGYKTLTLKSFTKLFKPEFSEDGSNARKFEGEVYALLLKYMREAASTVCTINISNHFLIILQPFIVQILNRQLYLRCYLDFESTLLYLAMQSILLVLCYTPYNLMLLVCIINYYA